MSETPTGWQPIETAPQDGTQVLLWDDHRKVAISGRWERYGGSHDVDGYECSWEGWNSDVGIPWGDGEEPLHWMPLHPPITEGERDA